MATTFIDDDIEAAYDRARPTIALYVGGMGAQEMNFHADVFRRLGYEKAVDEIQNLFLNGKQAEAIAAVAPRARSLCGETDLSDLFALTRVQLRRARLGKCSGRGLGLLRDIGQPQPPQRRSIRRSSRPCSGA